MDLDEIRRAIDEIDNEIIKLYKKRMELSDNAGIYKKKNSLPVHMPLREEEKLRILCSNFSKKADREEIKELFSYIMLISRKRQGRIFDEADRADI